MIEKRYYEHKHLLRRNEVHDKICHNFMSLDETVEHLNNEYWKYKQLKNENEELKQFRSKVFDMIEAFINGIEDEKGIDENNQQFQAEMNRALKYMNALKRELEKDD